MPRFYTDEELMQNCNTMEKQLQLEIRNLLREILTLLKEQRVNPSAPDKNGLESEYGSPDFTSMSRRELLHAVKQKNGGKGPKGYTRWTNGELIAYLKGEK